METLRGTAPLNLVDLSEGGGRPGGAEGLAGCLRRIGELGGGGLNIFLGGRNVHQVKLRKSLGAKHRFRFIGSCGTLNFAFVFGRPLRLRSSILISFIRVVKALQGSSVVRRPPDYSSDLDTEPECSKCSDRKAKIAFRTSISCYR